MIRVPTELEDTGKKVHNNERTRAIKLRTLLGWFGAKRRGANVCAEIRRALKKVDLVTEPDFTTVNIEGNVKFLPAIKSLPRGISKPPSANLPTQSTVAETDAEIMMIAEIEHADPSARVGTVFELRKPVSVTKNDTLLHAVTIMANRDFSQLPVMNGDRHVDGIISWKTIGDAVHVHKKPCDLVKDCLEKDGFDFVNSDCPLPKALRTLAGNDLVLVKDKTKRIVGIVTHADIADKYHELAEPFLLIGASLGSHILPASDGVPR